MKIVFTGGGSGGHFYPIIAIADQIIDLTEKNKLVGAELYYMAPNPYDEQALSKDEIIYKRIPAGKMRRYFSIGNFFDLFVTATGILKAMWSIYSIFPDVVVGKGGYGSFPVLFAAKFFGIPVIIHESDSKPGKVNQWAGKFAKKIAISYPEAAQYFPKEKVALTGNPLRKEITKSIEHGARQFLEMELDTPVILILGGSQGAKRINETIVDALPKLLEKYQIIHQVGSKNIDDIKNMISVVLENHPNKSRYRPFGYLNEEALRMSAGAADLVISRAGSTIFEIAAWGKPSIVIPIPEEISHDQHKNAFTYARSGAAEVLEEINLSPNLLLAEIDKILNNPEKKEHMQKAAKGFARLDAAEKIALEIVNIALQHEG